VLPTPPAPVIPVPAAVPPLPSNGGGVADQQPPPAPEVPVLPTPPAPAIPVPAAVLPLPSNGGGAADQQPLQPPPVLPTLPAPAIRVPAAVPPLPSNGDGEQQALQSEGTIPFSLPDLTLGEFSGESYGEVLSQPQPFTDADILATVGPGHTFLEEYHGYHPRSRNDFPNSQEFYPSAQVFEDNAFASDKLVLIWSVSGHQNERLKESLPMSVVRAMMNMSPKLLWIAHTPQPLRTQTSRF
jgi:hypothetical protein